MALDDETRPEPVAEPSPLDTDEIPILVPKPPRPPVWERIGTLGAAATALALLLALTGLLLAFRYRPTVATAHLDVVDLVEASPLGFARALHVWGSHLLLILVALHLLAVLMAGAYRPPRRGDYFLGLGLLVVVALLAVSGHVLPWDRSAQGLLQALHVDPAQGDGVLLAAHALHAGLLPVVATLLAVVHVRRLSIRGRADDAGEEEAS